MPTVDSRTDDEVAHPQSTANDASARRRNGDRPTPAVAHATRPPPADDFAESLEYWYFCGGGRDLREA